MRNGSRRTSGSSDSIRGRRGQIKSESNKRSTDKIIGLRSKSLEEYEREKRTWR